MPRCLRKQLFKKVKRHIGGGQKSAKKVSRIISMAPYMVPLDRRIFYKEAKY